MNSVSRRRLLLAASLCGIASLFATLPLHSAPPALVAPGGPKSPEEELKSFHLPPGFEIQLVAAEPYVRKPININFDPRGRLWVTESVEYPFPAPEGKPHRDSIRILEDRNGDGRADEVTTFTEGLNIPIGVLPLTRGAVVYSIPTISRFEDRDGDSRADGREVLYQTYGYRDTHGMTGEFTWGFDGWIYACHGFSNSSTVKAKDGTTLEMQSGNVYRFRPDGSRLEQFTHGQVNPFGLTFDPLGNLYSCDCHSRPIYQLLRGAYYPSFGKPHDGLGFAPEMMTHDHGSTAIAGLAYYAADQFPEAYRDTLFVGNVVTNRINHDRIEWHGSSPKAIQQPDFLTSDDPWFRPVDIKLGPDGALYVADFYNRIIGHYEVPLTHPGRDRERGRIWRIVYKGTSDAPATPPRKPRNDWTTAAVADLVQDLAHPNITVRMLATNQLVERGSNAHGAVEGALKSSANADQRVHALWVLERIGNLDEGRLDQAAQDPDRTVRTHAQRILSERKELSERTAKVALDGLNDADPFVQRAAADALARHPGLDRVQPLLRLLQAAPAADTHLRHVVRMTLREQFRADAAWKQFPISALGVADEKAVAGIAPGVPSAEAAAFLLAHLRRHAENGRLPHDQVQHCARYASPDRVVELLAFARDFSGPLNERVAIFKAFQQGTQARGNKLSADALRWAEGIVQQLLAAKNERDVLTGLELTGTLKLSGSRDLLVQRGTDHAKSDALRGAALTALVALDPKQAVPTLVQVLSDAGNPAPVREKSVQLLSGINRAEAQEPLVQALPTASSRLQIHLAVGLAGTNAGAEKLLEAVAAGKASPRLLQERFVEIRLAALSLPRLQERVAKLTQGLPPADERVQKLLQSRRDGFMSAKAEVARGQKVFEKNCAACHQVANQGTKIGPQLDGVGVRGLDRLLEDVLDPNRNVDQAFRMTTLNLNNGQVVSGLLLREQGAVLVLANAQGQEVMVPKEQVEERATSQLSPMPANLSEQIPENDFYDLLAFLLDQKQKK